MKDVMECRGHPGNFWVHGTQGRCKVCAQEAAEVEQTLLEEYVNACTCLQDRIASRDKTISTQAAEVARLRVVNAGLVEAGNALNDVMVCSTDVDATLAERGKRYGDFTDHARIAEALHGILVGDTPAGKFNTSWGTMKPFQRQALRVIADKIARILNGDPDYVDNWHDIQGYAKLVEDRLAE